MNEIQKFLKKLTKNERDFLIQKILPQILSGVWDDLDVKKMQGDKDLYRVRHGKIRVIFLKQESCIKILKIAFRKDAY